MHLHGDQIERYRTRELPQSTLAAIDAHISSCLYCSRSLAEVAASTVQWERRGWLARLVRVEEPVAAPFSASAEASEAKAA
jgi:hypothetical protein